MNFFEKVKGLLIKPSKTFDALKEESLGVILIYYIDLVAIFIGFVFIILLGSFASVSVSKDIEEAIIVVLWLFIFVFIYGPIFHIGVYVMGGRKGIDQTVKALMCAQTPSILGLGLLFVIISLVVDLGASKNEQAVFVIPVFFSAILWSLALEVIGVRQLQELTTSRAIVATLIFIVIASVLTRLFLLMWRANVI